MLGRTSAQGVSWEAMFHVEVTGEKFGSVLTAGIGWVNCISTFGIVPVATTQSRARTHRSALPAIFERGARKH